MRSAMSVTVGALVLLSVALTLEAAEAKPPTVNIYTQTPVTFGQRNNLICHCNGFHPPRLTMTLKKNGQEIKDCKESDLSFGRDWMYSKTIHTDFTPQEGETYECEVKHDESKPQTFRLENY
ncbi:beta-2-microglobulin [Leptodactylus fuscus]|uniref:beta-2-microglobulin n=1 Tax=Leptodactylus fuscus TaxID=238119 RepID=UPI003F4EE9CD